MEEFAKIISNLTDNARLSLLKADIWSQMAQDSYIGTEHLLVGILAQKGSIGASFLIEHGLKLKDIEVVLGIKHRSDVFLARSDNKILDQQSILAIENAWNLAKEYQQDYIGTEHILYVLASNMDFRATAILKELKVDVQELQIEIKQFIENQNITKRTTKNETIFSFEKNSPSILDNFSINLTQLAEDGKLDPVIGRNNQIERLITVLSRRTKSNPVLIGEPGVGKTAIVEGLAQRIVKAEVPMNLIGAEIIQIDLAMMVAGTKYRGQFEERLKKVINELTQQPTKIAFIDEIHLLMGAGTSEGAMDAANILKPALARGKISLIGATTFDEYRKYLKKDQAFDRRVQTIEINETTFDETMAIIKGLRKNFERHYDLVLNDEIINQAVTLSDKYINDRFMPDKAIDLIDEAAALRRVRYDKVKPEAKKYIFEYNKLETAINKALDIKDYQLAAKIKKKLDNLTTDLNSLKQAKRKTIVLTVDDLARIITLKTGIPIDKLTKNQKKNIFNLDKTLNKYIVGQSNATKAVAQAIKRSRSGISNSQRPIGSFVFLGPSGVGKTELAKVLAREVFGSNNALLKIDMSEFSEKHSLSKLLGAPAGYVGYDDGVKLIESIKRRPYQVILFDEIEKADPEVFNILLQILEEGVLTDASGQKIDFKQTIVILTSNLGTGEINTKLKKGNYGFDNGKKTAESKTDYSIPRKALADFMPPELINRFDEIIVFNSLKLIDVKKIIEILLSDLQARLLTKKINLIIPAKAKNYLIKRGFNNKDGARMLRRIIETEVENLIADNILLEKITPTDSIKLVINNKKLELEVKPTSKTNQLVPKKKLVLARDKYSLSNH